MGQKTSSPFQIRLYRACVDSRRRVANDSVVVPMVRLFGSSPCVVGSDEVLFCHGLLGETDQNELLENIPTSVAAEEGCNCSCDASTRRSGATIRLSSKIAALVAR